ncbi:hypothetical protein DWG18_04725 [Lysobacter sp. TY2-98]|uniref:hypothetical protein n=1 Tax=Lysobacter sp. TY2-98 TaxID=2290922 RepID=UPI000E1FCA03|nr:hypothetical protein [Lysobacter sp. TY2-98]AXK71661.1 hypothetical protein DWG18_04725 [Lysobacter sp. TY2-98]
MNCDTSAGNLLAPAPQSGNPLLLARVPYGPLVETCAGYGIKRTRAHEYAKSGLLATFTMGRKRYVYLSSLDSLPERIAAASQGNTAVMP